MALAFMADLLIIGGGLLGSCAAMLGAERGRQVILYRLEDQPTPFAESQRNQAWLQSGLHYSFGADITSAQVMGRAGKALVDELQLDAPRRGYMRLDPQQRMVIEDRALALGIDVRRVGSAVTSQVLRGCDRSNEGAEYWEVPDGPFPEADAIVIARNRARIAGAVMKEIRTVARFEEDADSLCGVAAIIDDDTRIGASAILVAAGAGTPALIGALGIRDYFKVVRTPLLLVTDPDVMLASLLVDRVQGYAMTQPLRGRLTFGIRFEEGQGIDPSDPNERLVSREEQRALVATFQASTGRPVIHGQHRFDAGFEIWRRDARGLAKYMPIIESHPQFPRVVWALPGRATMALAAAEQALERLESPEGLIAQIPHALPGLDWVAPVSMYYEEVYDHCNDAGEE